MKNSQKGFIVPSLIVIGLLVIGAGAFYISTKTDKTGDQQITPASTNDTKSTEQKSETAVKTYPFKVSLYDSGAFDSTFLMRAEINIYEGTKFVTAAVIMEGEVGMHTFNLPVGKYTVSVKSAGYVESRLPIEVKEETTLRYNTHHVSLVPLVPSPTQETGFKTFNYGDYKFSYPLSWEVAIAHPNLPVATRASFTENGSSIATLQCPIVESGYGMAWKVEEKKRLVSGRTKTYPVEWWKLTEGENLPDFSLIFINRDLSNGGEFAKSCQLRVEGRTYDPKVVQKIFESVSIVK